MLDAIKGLAGHGKLQKQSDELHGLIAEARAEREALGLALTQFTERRAEVSALAESLERLDQKAAASARHLEQLSSRLDALDEQARPLAGVQTRVEALSDATARAQDTLDRLTAPEGELNSHRRQVQQLASEALETQATLTALRKDRASLDDLRDDVKRSRADVQASAGEATVLRGELLQLENLAIAMREQVTLSQQVAQTARDDAAAAARQVDEIEHRLEPLHQIGELATRTGDQLSQLNALAEHTGQKLKALDVQRQVIDRALLEANRLNEMVWSMDVQIGKLNEGLKEAARGQETLTRIERLTEETEQKVDLALRMRNELTRDIARFDRDGQALVETLRGSLDTLSIEKREIEALDQRLRLLQGAMGDAESRIGAFASKERHLTEVLQQADLLSGRFDQLQDRADELAEKQATLDLLHTRLLQVEDLAKQTSVRYDSLSQGRVDLENLKRDMHEFHRSLADAAQLRDRLATDRAAMEAFGERLAAFRSQTPAIEASIGRVLGRLSEVSAATAQAVRLEELAAELDARLSRVAGRVEFIATLERRLNALHAMTLDVDQRIADQLERRAELDVARTAAEGVSARMRDAEARLDAVGALQERLLPLEERVAALRADLEAAARDAVRVRQEDAAVVAQQAQLEGLLERSRTVAAETGERLMQTQALNARLHEAVQAKDELLAGLSEAERRQRDVIAHSSTTEDHLQRVEAMFRTLGERQAQLDLAEQRFAGIERRFEEMGHATAAIDERINGVAERGALVDTVRTAIDAIHEVSARSKADLEYLTAHRHEISDVRGRLDVLLATAADADDKIAAIESRRKTIDAVHVKATHVANLLEDVRANLESLGQQKAVVEHIAVKIARLEFVMQEAQSTLRTLQHERELAERMEQNIAQLRARAALGPEGKVATA